MKKKIYIKEESIVNMQDKKKLLPKFLFNAVKHHKTSLGDSECFPMDDVYPFDYTILKQGYHNALNDLESLGYGEMSNDDLLSELSHLMTECKKQETPIRDTLERICENTINRLFAIPKDSVNIELELVDKIMNDKVRLQPESNSDIKYSFKDLDDIDLSNKAIAKRRFVDALVQGAAIKYVGFTDLYENEINKVNQDLMEMYNRIMVINNYLLYTQEEHMSDDKPMQGSDVKVKLGDSETRTTITVKGLIFPLLLQETIRGFFELFAAHGLPKNKRRAMLIVRKADFVLAEPWDMRLGTILYDMLFGDIEDTNVIPYLFQEYVGMDTDNFNNITKEILSNTEKGKTIKNDMVTDATYDNDYQEFTNRINARNLNRSMIADSYFTASELDGFNLDDDERDGNVITED